MTDLDLVRIATEYVAECRQRWGAYADPPSGGSQWDASDYHLRSVTRAIARLTASPLGSPGRRRAVKSLRSALTKCGSQVATDAAYSAAYGR